MNTLTLAATTAALAVSAFAPPLQAQDAADVVGSWESTMETPRGSITQEFVFTLTDGVLSGTVTGRRGGTVELQDVSFADGILSFTVQRNMRGNTLTQDVTVTVDGDTMTGEITGGRGGNRPFTATKTG